METVEAGILGTVYRNDENGYSVVSVRIGRNEYTVVGTLPRLSPGEQAVFTGEWIEHKQYGKQFKCSGCTLQTPTTLLGIERYLGSGLIKGIGPSKARAIVEEFGEDTLKILTEHPERLQDVPGIGKKRWIEIAESFREQQGARQAMVFLQSYGIPPTLSVKISKLYGERTPELIRENPYRLCEELEGVGFQTADRIGIALGVAPDSEDRIQCALKYVLREAAASSGHCYLPVEMLLSETSSLLRINRAQCEHSVSRLILAHELILEEQDQEQRIWLPSFWRAEKEVALRLRELMCAIHPGKYTGALQAIKTFEKKNGMSFSKTQREAIQGALGTGVFVITGGPGTGKTTIINCILSLLAQENEVLLCAPTGRAAKRMTEATGTESKTIHRLLEYGGEEGVFSRNAENPLEADVIIADETSMVDLMLMRSLLRAIEPGTRLILVGDADQLPSVGPGNVLGDILASGEIPAIRLTDIYRQSESSRIVVNAHRINHGEMPLLNEKGTDFFFERKNNSSDTSETIRALVTQRLPAFLKYPEDERLSAAIRSIQVLAPARKGECGVIALNTMLQAALNPPSDQKPQLSWGETIFRLGDKVMQTKNDYQIEWRRQTKAGYEDGSGIFNGDVGYVTEVDVEEHTLTVCFDDDREVIYESSALENLELAYCLSVHKSQGSEFPVVVMPVTGGPPMLLTRNLFYTALTRARKLVVLVGQEEIIRRMTENGQIAKRYTALTSRIRETKVLGLSE